MRIKKLFPLFVAGLCFAFVPANAQQAAGYTDFNNYTPLYCSGEIPSPFLASVQDKYRADVKEEAKTSKGKYVSKTKDQFLLQSNFFIDLLLQSGKVLFGDSVTNYVNTVADHVLINEPALRSKLTFYCLRSDEPNAFCTDQGYIFVTVGLLAQLENEAQLAFILSHEIAHYEKRHTLNVYLKKNEIFNDSRGRNSVSLDGKIREFSNHEKSSELEADSLGLIRLSKTGYDCSEAIGALFVLQFSHLPFDDYDFPSHSFERPLMVFPPTLFLDNVRPIKLDGDKDDDQYSSHPNIARRRGQLEKQLGGMKVCGTVKYATSATQFELIRNICRFEVVRLEVIARNYTLAVYNATYLQKYFPGSLYLERTVAKSLYCIAKYRNAGQFNDGAKNYTAVEGKQQQCSYLFQKMSAEQVTAVALRTLYDLSLKDSSAITHAMLNDLGTEAVYKHNMTMAAMLRSLDLYNEAKADSAKKEEAAPVVTQAGNDSSQVSTGYVSKYDKLKKEKKEKDKKDVVQEKTVEKSKFHLLAFGELLGDPKTRDLFARFETQADQRRALEEQSKNKYEGMSPYEERKAREREKKKNVAPAPLGIDTLLVVDPFFYYSTEWQGYQPWTSEQGKFRLCDNIVEVAEQAQLPVVLFSMKEFTKNDIDKYNELSLLNDWIEESINHNDMAIIPCESEFTAPLCKKYHADNFMITGVISIKQKRENRGGILLLSVLCYPLLPLGVAIAVTPEHETYLLSGIYNLQTGQQPLSREIRLKAKARTGYISSQLYDIFVGIQRTEQPGKKGGRK